MDMETGIKDDFEGTPAANNEPAEHEEFDLSQPYVAITGDDGKEITLTGAEVVERLGKSSDYESQIRELQAQIEAAKSQPAPLAQPQFKPAQSGNTDPTIDQQAQQALEDFANGDMTAIPLVLSLMTEAARQAARQAARDETSGAFNSYSREQAFTGRFPEAQALVNDSEFKNFAQANRHVFSDGVQAAIAYMGEKKTAALQKENETLRAQIVGAQSKGKQDGEKQALQTLKARGGIRLLQSGNASGPRGNGKQETPRYSNSEDAANGMKAALMKLRGTTTLD